MRKKKTMAGLVPALLMAQDMLLAQSTSSALSAVESEIKSSVTTIINIVMIILGIVLAVMLIVVIAKAAKGGHESKDAMIGWAGSVLFVLIALAVIRRTFV